MISVTSSRTTIAYLLVALKKVTELQLLWSIETILSLFGYLIHQASSELNYMPFCSLSVALPRPISPLPRPCLASHLSCLGSPCLVESPQCLRLRKCLDYWHCIFYIFVLWWNISATLLYAKSEYWCYCTLAAFTGTVVGYAECLQFFFFFGFHQRCSQTV